jgi:RecA/RadA recombinase
MPLIEYEQLDNLLEVVLKIKKQMKIVKLVVNLWQTEKASIQFDIIEGKIKQEEKSLSWFQQGESN